MIHEPDLLDWRRNPKPAKHLAQAHPLGTIVEDERGNQWRVEWDDQDREHMWVKHTEKPAPDKRVDVGGLLVAPDVEEPLRAALDLHGVPQPSRVYGRPTEGDGGVWGTYVPYLASLEADRQPIHHLWYPLFDTPITIRTSREMVQSLVDELCGTNVHPGWAEYTAKRLETLLGQDPEVGGHETPQVGQ